MLLAAALFDPYRTPATMQRSPSGEFDEAMHMTPGMFARLENYLFPRQRAFALIPVKRRAVTHRGRP